MRRLPLMFLLLCISAPTSAQEEIAEQVEQGAASLTREAGAARRRARCLGRVAVQLQRLARRLRAASSVRGRQRVRAQIEQARMRRRRSCSASPGSMLGTIVQPSRSARVEYRARIVIRAIRATPERPDIEPRLRSALGPPANLCLERAWRTDPPTFGGHVRSRLRYDVRADGVVENARMDRPVAGACITRLVSRLGHTPAERSTSVIVQLVVIVEEHVVWTADLPVHPPADLPINRPPGFGCPGCLSTPRE